MYNLKNSLSTSRFHLRKRVLPIGLTCALLLFWALNEEEKNRTNHSKLNSQVFQPLPETEEHDPNGVPPSLKAETHAQDIDEKNKLRQNSAAPRTTMQSSQNIERTYTTKDNPQNKRLTADEFKRLTPEQKRAELERINQAKTPEQRERSAHRRQLVKFAREQNWKGFIAVAKEFLARKKFNANFILSTAIHHKAPNWVFKTLFNYGAQFASTHVFRIAKMNDLSFLKRLVSVGLNIHLQIYNGGNVVNELVIEQSSLNNLEYLLQQNVPIVTPKNGKSPVTVALTKAVKIDQAVLFAAKLLQYGAHPSAEDYALVEELKLKNPKAYQLVQAHIPELIRGE